MKTLILVPNTTNRSLEPLWVSLAANLGGEVVETDVRIGALPLEAMTESFPPLTSRLNISEHWLDSVLRYSNHHLTNPPTIDELRDWIPLAESLSNRLRGDVIVALDEAVIPVALSATEPYVAVITNPSIISPSSNAPQLSGALALALHAAPIVVAANLTSWFGLTNVGTPGIYFCPVTDNVSRPPEEHPDLGDAAINTLIACPLFKSEGRDEEEGDRLSLEIAAELLQRSANPDESSITIPGPVDEKVMSIAGELGIAARISWLTESTRPSDSDFRNASVMLIPPTDVYSLDESLVRAASYGKPTIVTTDISFLNTMHSAPVPAVEIRSASAVDLGLLQSLRLSSVDWFESERSLAAVTSRLASLTQSVGSGGHISAPVYSLRQKRWELLYESEAASKYDEKYHDAVCYQHMDRRLVESLAAASVASADVETARRPRILDLGCGPGSLVPFLRTIPNSEIVGVDLSPEMILLAKSRYPDIDFQVGDCEALSFPDGSFDVVLCSGVVHHLPSLDATISEVKRVLRDDGVWLLREPNNDHFAFRNPLSSFVHLCLKHHLHSALGRPPVEEPDPHEDHHDIGAGGFVEALGRDFLVEAVWTDLRVSYFYDMILSETLFKPVEVLEASLDNQPGMNLMVSCRKSETPGIGADAQQALSDLAVNTEVDIEHFVQLDAAIDWFERQAPLRLPSSDDLQVDGWRCVVPTGFSRVLVLSDDPQRLSDVVASVHGDGIRHGLLFSQAASESYHDYDVVIVQVVNQASEQELAVALRFCRDYGFIYLETAPGATITGSAEELPDYPFVSVAYDTLGRAGWSVRCLLAPMTYTVADARRGLRSVLQNLEERPPGRIDELLSSLERKIARAETLGDFGVARARLVGNTLRRVLDGQ